jgi:class 3 adenylate cyclase
LTGYAMEATDLYKDRFENLFRVARKVTSSLNIGDILEFIRDEAKVTIPYAAEACLLVFDPDAARYTRPLHCGVYKDRLNCQLCKRGRDTIQKALSGHTTLQCALSGDQQKCLDCEVGQEMGKTSEPAANGTPLGDSDGSLRAPITRPCDIALPIYDDEKPLAVLELIANEGHTFTERDVVLLKDLTQLATNAIVNARRHWKVAQEKLNMDQILAHLRPFVPETVQRIVEKDPSAPFMGKQDVDISVLFLDVAGYTRISENLTREKLNFIIEKYFSSFLDVIYNFEGDINETAGDGLMVMFQGDKERNGLNAAWAALEIRNRTLEINRELEGRFDPIHVNMGINSGLASVGMTKFSGAAGTRMTFTATGPVTNLAARIAAAATEGDILVGPETAARIQKKILFYDRGPMAFKNVKDEVCIFSLVRPK